jgi:hypothetical protein
MEDPRHRARIILLAFILCGVLDFLWGYFHEHSIGEGLVGVVLGVFGTAWYLFLSGAWERDE